MRCLQSTVESFGGSEARQGRLDYDPGEVNRWWRQRAEMRLVENGHGWQVEGLGKERARVAYASEEGGRLVLTLEEP